MYFIYSCKSSCNKKWQIFGIGEIFVTPRSGIFLLRIQVKYVCLIFNAIWLKVIFSNLYFFVCFYWHLIIYVHIRCIAVNIVSPEGTKHPTFFCCSTEILFKIDNSWNSICGLKLLRHGILSAVWKHFRILLNNFLN